MIKYLFLFLFSIGSKIYGQEMETEKQCSIAHEGTFVYGNSKVEIVVTREGNKQTDQINVKGKAYYIYSEVEWLNDCEYNSVIVSTTIPKSKYQPGDVLHVVIDKVDGRDIYFTASKKGESRKDVMRKL